MRTRLRPRNLQRRRHLQLNPGRRTRPLSKAFLKAADKIFQALRPCSSSVDMLRQLGFHFRGQS